MESEIRTYSRYSNQNLSVINNPGKFDTVDFPITGKSLSKQSKVNSTIYNTKTMNVVIKILNECGVINKFIAQSNSMAYFQLYNDSSKCFRN